MKNPSKHLAAFADAYRVGKKSHFKLKDIDPADTGKLKSDQQADELLAESIRQMSDLQARLYAQDDWSLLLIFQAMDAAGKDGTIKHVMSGINPQGCQVTSFKAPSPVDLSHDYLWRSTAALPERGRIGIFNRSYYEEVLVVRVHKQVLKAEKIPAALLTKHLWDERFEDIAAHERYLARNGTVIRKFFLHISKAEQKRRFLARLDEPAKNWKFSAADLKERGYWDDYMQAYEEMIRATSTEHAPWYVVPADNKRFAHLVVASAIIETLQSLKIGFPKMTAEQEKALHEAKAQLG